MPGVRTVIGLALLVCLVADGRRAAAQIWPRGEIVDTVTAADDASESYALYLPSDYTADRPWSLLLAFHPGARGRAIVELYRAAAERYGYVVAGSNTSRNGPWETSAKAVRAMSRDVAKRFAIDADRIYLTGHSGGARVAMETAAGNRDVAGVIASSAGFGDARPRTSVRFAVFATTGIDDFNYREMRALNAALRSPHALAVFEGGHTLPPAAVAMQAIEWMELQAMRARRRETDRALVARWLADRLRRAEAFVDAASRVRALREVVADFDGLADVGAAKSSLVTLEGDPAAVRALADDHDALGREERLLNEALDLEARLGQPDLRTMSLARLGALMADWSRTATRETPSPERSQARRLLAGLAAGAGRRAEDAEYLALLAKYRWRE
jgi:poly(3-hydroxybutyrate) depolymerase